MTSVSVALKEQLNSEVAEQKDVLKSFLWDEENRLLAVNNNGSVSCYFYDAAGERTVKLTSETEMVHVNGKKVGGNDAVTKFTAYVSPYFVVSNGGAYTKHIYAASQRIASKLGNEDGFGADPRRVEMAGGKKISDFQKGNVGERFKALGYEYSAPEKEKVEKDSTMDSEEEEKLIFFYHPDHLGSTSYVTDADGNIAQHIEYIPYGEVFVEERNNSFSTSFLFNAKELDNETGLYYYGARYLDPTGGMWLSVDPLFEKYAGLSPYNYCMGNPVVMVDPDGRKVKNWDESGLPTIQNKIDIYEKNIPKLKEDRESEIYKSVDKKYRRRYETQLKNRDIQNKLIKKTAGKINTFQKSEPTKYNEMDNLKGNYKVDGKVVKEVNIDVYITSEYKKYQRDPDNPSVTLEFTSGGYTQFPSINDVVNAAMSGGNLSVYVHLDPSLPENTDRIAHELGHIHSFASDMLKYIQENKAGDNCQEIAK